MSRLDGEMLKKYVALLALVLMPVCLCAQQQRTQDLYWISYMTHAPSRGFYHMLMQINQFGKITAPPVRVSYIREPWNDSAIFIDDFGRLNLWTFYDRRGLYRYILDGNVNPPAVTAVSRVRTNVKSNFPFARINLTQAPSNNFLTIVRWNNQYYAHIYGFKIGSAGELVSKPWVISPPFLDHQVLQNAGVASKDGRIAFFNGRPHSGSDLFLQSLNTAGVPSGKPLYIDSERNSGHGRISQASVSNVLANKKRLAAYVVNSKSAGSYEDPDKIFIQAIDSAVTRKIGNRVPLQKPNEQFWGSHGVAVDPKGRFVVYGIVDSPTLYYALIFQQLDRDGKPLGGRILLSDRCVSGIDMVKIP